MQESAGQYPDSAALILAGGMSSRMGGSPKAALVLGNENLLTRKVCLLKALFAEIIISVPFGGVSSIRGLLPQSLQGMVVFAEDKAAGIGPLAGLSRGMRKSSRPLIYVSTVDSPYISLPLIRLLHEQCSGHDAAVPLWQGYPEPLTAIYAARCAGAVRRSIAAGKRKIISFYDSVDVAYAAENTVRLADPSGRAFVNINTAADYVGLLEFLNEREAANESQQGNA